MKKLLAVLLLLAVIALSVAACGKDEVEPPTDSGSDTSDTTPAPTDTSDTSDTQGGGETTENPKDVWEDIDSDAVDDPDDSNWTPRL